ncbi:MAG: hypothetical protein ACE5FT_00785 [Candidatus Nanoarchaeia archaeon]
MTKPVFRGEVMPSSPIVQPDVEQTRDGLESLISNTLKSTAYVANNLAADISIGLMYWTPILGTKEYLWDGLSAAKVFAMRASMSTYSVAINPLYRIVRDRGMKFLGVTDDTPKEERHKYEILIANTLYLPAYTAVMKHIGKTTPDAIKTSIIACGIASFFIPTYAKTLDKWRRYWNLPSTFKD